MIVLTGEGVLDGLIHCLEVGKKRRKEMGPTGGGRKKIDGNVRCLPVHRFKVFSPVGM